MQTGIRHQLTLLAAPAGFGKTMLLSNFAQQSEQPIAWVSLEKSDNDPIRFWSYVLTAVESIRPGMTTTAQSLLHTEQPVAIETVLIALINALQGLQEDSILVLDDYHTIEETSIHDTVIFLLDHLPPRMHIIIASRVDPPLPLARMRVRGQVVELRSNHLRFTTEEATTFLNKVMGLQLNSQQINILEARTEGWIAGLQLAALTLQGSENTSDAFSAFAGSHRYIVDYLMEEVLRQQPEKVQRFLLYTSILERLNGALCDAVTEQVGGQDMLERLERANLFLLPLDEERSWYRYHHLFADMLRSRLQLFYPAAISELHTRASGWFEQHNFIAQAIDHALAAKDFATSSRLLSSITTTMIERGEYITLLHWLEAHPEEELRNHPSLCFQYAWILLFTGQVEAYERPLNMAEQAWRAENNQPLLGRVYHFRMNMARLRGDPARTIALAQQALAALPQEDEYNRGSVLVALGASYLLLGQLIRAEQYLREGATMSRAAHGIITALLAANYQGDMHLVRGALHQATATYRQVLDEAGTRLLWQVAEANIGLARVLYAWNRLEEAGQYIEQALVLARETRREVYFSPGYLVLAQLLQARGESHEIENALSKAIHAAQRLDNKVMLRQAETWQMRRLLSRGRLTEVEQWRQRVGIDIHDKPSYERSPEYLILARLYLTRAQPQQALSLLDRLLRADEAEGRMGNAMQVLALMVLAHYASGDTLQAIFILEHLLNLAAPEEYVRLFVDEGTAMREMLSVYLAQPKSEHHTVGGQQLLDYARKLFAAFPQQTLDAPASELNTKQAAKDSLIEPLSAREQEILALLAAGLSNAQIAARLVVTVGTVKTHIKSMYAKLGVHSRTQAIVRARELNLLG